jgi:hypothetical protein
MNGVLFTANTKNLLDKLKVTSSRDPSGAVEINRECYGKQVQYLLYQHYRVPTMVGPTLPRLVILCWCSNMETRLEFLCSTSASWIMKDHFALLTTIVATSEALLECRRHYERWYYGSYSIEIRDPAIFECHIDVLIPKNLLDKLKVASSRDPSELSQSIECYGKQVQCLLYQHYRNWSQWRIQPWTEYFEC